MKLPWCIEEENRRIIREKEWAEESKNAIRVRDMEEGDWGYIVPWAFDFKTKTPDPNARILPNEFGTASLWIRKDAEGRFDYHSRFDLSDYNPNWWKKLLMKLGI